MDWGFSISKTRQIDYDTNDKSVSDKLIEKVPDCKLCISCGGCTATCTAGIFTEFNIRVLQTLLKRGENQEVFYNINKCMLCGKCLLVCPRGVDTRKMILAIMEIVKNSGENNAKP